VGIISDIDKDRGVPAFLTYCNYIPGNLAVTRFLLFTSLW